MQRSMISCYNGTKTSGSQQTGSLSDNKDDGNKNGEKAIGLYQQNNFACASPIFVHFLATVTWLQHKTS